MRLRHSETCFEACLSQDIQFFAWEMKPFPLQVVKTYPYH